VLASLNHPHMVRLPVRDIGGPARSSSNGRGLTLAERLAGLPASRPRPRASPRRGAVDCASDQRGPRGPQSRIIPRSETRQYQDRMTVS
jgi:hypothetical protein